MPPLWSLVHGKLPVHTSQQNRSLQNYRRPLREEHQHGNVVPMTTSESARFSLVVLALNPRRAGGGGAFLRPPQVFRRRPMFQKRPRAAPPVLAHFIIHLFRIVSENFSPRSSKVRSPVEVKWPNLRKVQTRVLATRVDRSLWNFQQLLRLTRCTQCISRIFVIGDLRSGQFCDLPIITGEPVGEISVPTWWKWLSH